MVKKYVILTDRAMSLAKTASIHQLCEQTDNVKNFHKVTFDKNEELDGCMVKTLFLAKNQEHNT